jgi:hypothetical protein
MTIRPGRVVAVVGPGDDASDEVYSRARQVGRLLAGRGAVVVTGGLGGVMAAAAQGARDGGGLVIGLLPGADRGSGNEHLTVAIPTGLGQARNAVIVRAADGLVAVGGGWGTLSEVALARRAALPVVWLWGWQVRDADGGLVEVLGAESPEDAVAQLAAALRW